MLKEKTFFLLLVTKFEYFWTPKKKNQSKKVFRCFYLPTKTICCPKNAIMAVFWQVRGNAFKKELNKIHCWLAKIKKIFSLYLKKVATNHSTHHQCSNFLPMAYHRIGSCRSNLDSSKNITPWETSMMKILHTLKSKNNHPIFKKTVTNNSTYHQCNTFLILMAYHHIGSCRSNRYSSKTKSLWNKSMIKKYSVRT